MSQTIDILDEPERLGGPFVWAIFLHIGVLVFVLGYGIYAHRAQSAFGTPNPAAGAYTVTVVNSIPIPRRSGPEVPLANDTESQVPVAAAKKVEEKREPVPPKNAIEIPDKVKPRKQVETRNAQKWQQPIKENQITSRTAPAATSSMYNMQAGSQGVGIGPNSPLGQRFGWYAELVRRRLAQAWQTNGLGGQRSAAIVSFVIQRNGAVTNVNLDQSSGNVAIDNSALRAVYNSNPMPALPSDYDHSSAPAQFTFDLR